MSQTGIVEKTTPLEHKNLQVKKSSIASFFQNKLNLVAFIFLVLITLITVGADVIAGGRLKQNRDIIDISLIGKMVDAGLGQPPYPPGTNGHLLGTDGVGRDALARLNLFRASFPLCWLPYSSHQCRYRRRIGYSCWLLWTKG